MRPVWRPTCCRPSRPSSATTSCRRTTNRWGASSIPRANHRPNLPLSSADLLTTNRCGPHQASCGPRRRCATRRFIRTTTAPLVTSFTGSASGLTTPIRQRQGALGLRMPKPLEAEPSYAKKMHWLSNSHLTLPFSAPYIFQTSSSLLLVLASLRSP